MPTVFTISTSPPFDFTTSYAFDEHQESQGFLALFRSEIPLVYRGHDLSIMELLHFFLCSHFTTFPEEFPSLLHGHLWCLSGHIIADHQNNLAIGPFHIKSHRIILMFLVLCTIPPQIVSCASPDVCFWDYPQIIHSIGPSILFHIDPTIHSHNLLHSIHSWDFRQIILTIQFSCLLHSWGFAWLVSIIQ